MEVPDDPEPGRQQPRDQAGTQEHPHLSRIVSDTAHGKGSRHYIRREEEHGLDGAIPEQGVDRRGDDQG